jgi:hypothetical protein
MVLCGGGLATAMSAHAQFRAFERLVMPGPLVASHAEYEADCAQCHVQFNRSQQRTLCLDCHEEIAEDFATGTGFHSLSPDVGQRECSQCHTDHTGRDTDILGLDIESFDHDLTDFHLLGKHAEVECEGCHLPNLTFHDAELDCVSCHRDDDQHRGNLGDDCAACHAETAWTDVTFDHEAETMYALLGKHAETDCVSCHIDEQYESTSTYCVSCHREDDTHKGTNGTECQNCHTALDWAEVLFNHFEATGFALSGGHSGLDCDNCHTGNKFEQSLSQDCYDCHADDDAHMGVNGRMCNDCHRVTEWLDTTFDHNRDTDFALHDAHADLTCDGCHLEPVALALPATDCFGCHADDDPHAGQLGEACQTCHGELEFTVGVRFDHDLTAFPLLGRHEEIDCEDCHATKAFHDADDQCVDCHIEDDVHEARFGADCAFCHTPLDWQRWTFNHSTQTDFVLDGSHAGLDCHACHRNRVATTAAITLATNCGSCHRSDDVHDGEFGQDCEQCHTTESFGALREVR